jgi:hypothetical protein
MPSPSAPVEIVPPALLTMPPANVETVVTRIPE